MKLNNGINLGGYLSQCNHETEHYEHFIGEDDVKKIAEWGFDHIRIPIDYEVLEDEKGNKKKEGYGYVERLLEWCKQYNLGAVLDLHKAYGYDFNDAGNEKKNNLFSDDALQERFIRLWMHIASAYGAYDNVAFELLNEVVEKENAAAWNLLIHKTVTAIRGVAAATPIIYGGIQWNSARTLKFLDIPQDDNIIFTFHFYEPLLFTHQKAPWVENMDLEKDIFYPESMTYYQTQSEALGYQGEIVMNAKSKTMGKEFISEMVNDAVEAAKRAGVGLYCGEFGVIDRAPAEDTVRWFTDVNQVFKDNGIGGAIWNYKEKDFGLLSEHYDSIRDNIISSWTQRQ